MMELLSLIVISNHYIVGSEIPILFCILRHCS
uniref:Uncharacterized protein n=1 Tax=Arundo donax TaxID=35708 RepID=A0A0A9GSL0_ARUDO